ncbi:metallophosphoesterase family protein [Adhaeretor mobilis]|uniref:Putative metallophosphoesterase YhaO n=1 Tax=Adhaeretor mobilis TaxID=1930276 RepID=A0A517MVM2_9BACT|nr:DNA repair exonuclease [Adhaeretor mobilis]QDS98928.1 putative metallophosphoesterase YhaO [Adhaeretor mobilis]
MSQPPLRFLHASDFHLERPLGGVSELPAHLREVFLEAPYVAAEQVFETALAEGVDALVLSGDIVDLDFAGPRAIVFLSEQFERLAAHNIAVYWAGGDIDPPDAWPPNSPLPENVHVFPVGRVETLEHQRDGAVVARVQGVSRSQGKGVDDSGFHRDAHGQFTLGVSYGTAAAPGEEGDRVHYMALGGHHKRQTVDQSPGIAHYSGTIQGRSPEESGPHGCTLVNVDEAGHVKTTFVHTDAIRWVSETIEVTSGADESAMMSQIRERIAKLKIKHSGHELLVTWRIEGRGELVNFLRRGGLSDDLLIRLRKRYGEDSPVIWSVAVECEEEIDVPGEWYDQETIMGDLLRQFRQLRSEPDTDLQLEEFMPAALREGAVATLAEVKPEDRDTLLLAASKLGIEMLTYDDEEDED